MRQIRMLRAKRRELETGLRQLLHGHEGENPGDGQGAAYGLPRQSPTLPGSCISAWPSEWSSLASPSQNRLHAGLIEVVSCLHYVVGQADASVRSRSKSQNGASLFFDPDIQDGFAAIATDSPDTRAQHRQCRQALLSLCHRVGNRSPSTILRASRARLSDTWRKP